MNIEIGIKGKGIVIITLRKYEENKSIAFNEGFSMARRLYDPTDDAYKATLEEGE